MKRRGASKMPMDQNTIALVWDFDKTLINGYMQEPLFKKYGVDSKAFWNEVNSLEQKYMEQDIRVNKDTIYLNHIITCAHQGLFPGLSNDELFALGSELEFYPGALEILKNLKSMVSEKEDFQRHSIHVEHYIVSTGITAMIKGSKAHELVDGVWGCEFIERPILSSLTGANAIDVPKGINQTGYIIDNTSKTRAIFEINKGANVHKHIQVNSSMDKKVRRVPFEYMIYIADGPSDVPVFSILRQYGGKTFAVYPKGDIEAFTQVKNLQRDGRIDTFGEADYREGEHTYMILASATMELANMMYQKKEDEIRQSASLPPTHLTE